MALTKILNFVQLTPNVGTAGQPSSEQFGDIAAAGYAAVVNLAMHDSDNAVPNEGNIVACLGMTYVHLPVDFAAPTSAHARKFFGVMAVLDGDKVFVHCAMNLRVSAFMYLYLKHIKGFDEAAAQSPMIAKWKPRMDQVWQDFLALSEQEIMSAQEIKNG